MKVTVVRLSAPSAEGEAKPKARSVVAALLERAEQLVDLPRREAAAFVVAVYFDELLEHDRDPPEPA